MSKILAATCSALGIVTADGVTVPTAEVLSLGTGASSGLLYLEGDKAWYIPSSATDIEETLDKAIDSLDAIGPALTEIASTLTAIGAGMTGPTTTPPPTLGVSVSNINSKVALINTAKSALTTLKGALK